MSRVLTAVAGVVVALCCAAAAGAHLIVGVNESALEESTTLPWFFPTMQSEGLGVDSLTLRWDDTQPTTIDPVLEAEIAADIQAASSAGVTVVLDLYPLHSQAFTKGLACNPSPNPQACGNSAKISAFAAWTAQVAQTFPTVHQFVVMNECNQPLFVNPQWNSAGRNQSAEICGRALAAAYTALKAVGPSNFIWGVGLSPRGNDNPRAATDSSTSPVRFLIDLGAWFRAFVHATGRTQPLMNGFDFHPYPVPQSLSLKRGYADKNDATVANLPRIYEAFYRGFRGTPQRTIGQQIGGRLPVSLNELGVQTAESGVPGYTGVEVSATPSGGVRGATATQAYQATTYVQMLKTLSCDPNVRVVNLFHLVDDSDLAGWQSGLYAVPPPLPFINPTALATGAAAALATGNAGTSAPGTASTTDATAQSPTDTTTAGTTPTDTTTGTSPTATTTGTTPTATTTTGTTSTDPTTTDPSPTNQSVTVPSGADPPTTDAATTDPTTTTASDTTTTGDPAAPVAALPPASAADDPVAKLSAAAVRQWIASSGGNCQGTPRRWYPAPPAARALSTRHRT